MSGCLKFLHTNLLRCQLWCFYGGWWAQFFDKFRYLGCLTHTLTLTLVLPFAASFVDCETLWTPVRWV